MKNQALTSISFLILSCILCSFCTIVNSWQENFKHVKLKLYTAGSDFEKKNIYKINYPSNWALIKKRNNMGHAVFEEITLEVEGTKMIFYISNDFMNGAHLNLENRIVAGLNSHMHKKIYDTIDINGLNVKNNLYWREKILGDIVVGYTNVPLISKGKMDIVIASLENITR